ncbi:MAG TPA: fibronectin type III domain-containing protein [Terriglobales bacterium]|nr:fibronectin type III domain-containing protein [Terriglobales bacterium]
MRLGAAVCVCAVQLLCVGCGTPGAPQPPSLNLAAPVSDLKAERTAHRVTLTWTIPTDTTDGARFRHRGQTRICRAVNQPSLSWCSPIGVLDTPANVKTGSFTSDLPAEASAPSDYAIYAVQVDNSNGRNAGLSNQIRVPTANVSDLNGSPTMQLMPDSVLVKVNVTPRATTIEQFLELRRKEKGTPAPEGVVARRVLDSLNGGKPANVELRDDTFAWEKTYEYRVAIVASAKIPNAETFAFDAAISAPQELVAHDIFPPAVPAGLQAVFAGQLPGQEPAIDLTWNPDVDRDLAGYFIYRRLQGESQGAAVKLNTQPITTPAYHDAGVEAGNTYLYSVSAIDERGNESKRSEEASELVPK